MLSLQKQLLLGEELNYQQQAINPEKPSRSYDQAKSKWNFFFEDQRFKPLTTQRRVFKYLKLDNKNFQRSKS